MLDQVVVFRMRSVDLRNAAITIEDGEVAGSRRASDSRLAMLAQMVLVADVHGRVGLVTELRALLADLADASRAEPECVDFRVLAGDDPGEFVLLSVWRDEAALRAHYDSPHYHRYRAQVGPFLARPSDVVVYQVSSVIHARDPNPPDPGYFG
jgi:quinol monooxygenase YgiN